MFKIYNKNVYRKKLTIINLPYELDIRFIENTITKIDYECRSTMTKIIT